MNMTRSLFTMLTVMVDAEATAGVSMAAVFTFTDTQVTLRVQIRRGVCQVSGQETCHVLYNSLLICFYAFFPCFKVTKVTADGATVGSGVDMEVVTTETVWREVRRGYVICL